MKMRISIIFLGVSLLLNAGCSTMKTAYSGDEDSRFANPAKKTATTNTQGLAPVAEAPVTSDVHAQNPGGTGEGSMAGESSPNSWGGSLSDR